MTNNRLWILGPASKAMSDIAELLTRAGETYVYATTDNGKRRVTDSGANMADPINLLLGRYAHVDVVMYVGCMTRGGPMQGVISLSVHSPRNEASEPLWSYLSDNVVEEVAARLRA